MTFYDFTSTLLTVVGYSVLVYRIIFQLQSGKLKKSKQQKLCTKWLIFTIYLRVQYYILAIVQIIPLGALCMLVFKLFLFLPENAISHMIYKKIQKNLEKIKLQEYNSQVGIAISFVCTTTVSILIKLIVKIAAYIDLKHVDSVEKCLQDIKQILQYKKSAIHLRNAAAASQVNRQLNSSEFNISVDENDEKRMENKPQVDQRTSRILDQLQHEQSKQMTTIKAEQMIIKPNKTTGQKAKYEDVTVQYYYKTSKISFTNKYKANESKTLKEIKWITKNMMNIEVVFKQGGSKILKIKEPSDISKWVQPVCINLLRIKDQIA